MGSSELVGQAVDRFEVRARDAGIDLQGQVAFGVPPVRVDLQRVEHVFDNLIGNALAHTDREGSVRVSAERDGANVRFTVTDTGEGIPPEHLSRIFERFYRVPAFRAGGGAGLGLAIAREIVAAHDGQIEASSVSGRGSTFTVRFPAAPGGDKTPNSEGATT